MLKQTEVLKELIKQAKEQENIKNVIISTFGEVCKTTDVDSTFLNEETENFVRDAAANMTEHEAHDLLKMMIILSNKARTATIIAGLIVYAQK